MTAAPEPGPSDRPRTAAQAERRSPAGAAAAPLAFITGASSGIGQALAARYRRAGYRLALVARRTDRVANWCAAEGCDPTACAIYRADVRDVDSIVGAARKCLAEQGLPEVVIASAGISVGMDTADPRDLPLMRSIVETNLLGTASTFHPFVAAMRERGSGTLVAISSVAGVRGLPGHGAYSASKAAVIAYAESLRGELRGSGVRVVTILPGFVATPMTRGNPFGMPFLMTAPDFAERACRAIGRGTRSVVIPWPMAIVVAAMRLLPDALYDRLASGRGRKPREDRD